MTTLVGSVQLHLDRVRAALLRQIVGLTKRFSPGDASMWWSRARPRPPPPPAVSDLSLELIPGEVCVLLGRNGW